MSQRYMFVGEKRSRRAIDLGVTWADGKLCAKTLQRALLLAGVPREEQHYRNLFLDGDGWYTDCDAVFAIVDMARSGWTIVGLGRRVQRVLTRKGIPHTALIHPAARGSIRRLDRYQQYVIATLAGGPR